MRTEELEKLLVQKELPVSRWEEIFLSFLQGREREAGMRAILLLLAKKGEGANEITGCLRALRRLEPPRSIGLPFLMDVCGTGGDQSHSFNISTVSAFVAAGGGAYVAKHGNRSVSSRVGSSDLMEALGIRIDVPLTRMIAALKRYRLGYFHAPLYHSSFSRVQGVRQSLGIRTLFNVMGPLVNPFRLSHQMMGVSDPRYLGPVARALKELHLEKAAVFHSEDGMDELSTRAPSDILYLERNHMRRFLLDPQKWGLSKPKGRCYEGGDRETNRKIALGILQGRLRGPALDIVLLNSGFSLWLAGLAADLKEGIERSRWTLRTGRAFSVLEGLRRGTSGKAV